jgi:hypothetical protein
MLFHAWIDEEAPSAPMGPTLKRTGDPPNRERR